MPQQQKFLRRVISPKSSGHGIVADQAGTPEGVGYEVEHRSCGARSAHEKCQSRTIRYNARRGRAPVSRATASRWHSRGRPTAISNVQQIFDRPADAKAFARRGNGQFARLALSQAEAAAEAARRATRQTGFRHGHPDRPGSRLAAARRILRSIITRWRFRWLPRRAALPCCRPRRRISCPGPSSAGRSRAKRRPSILWSGIIGQIRPPF
jgi:hypothetical protein